MTENKILDRIRKLLNQAKSDNVHEAALAASRAQELMLQYKIELADIELATGEKQAKEEVVEQTIEGDIANRVRVKRWRIDLADALGHAFNCKIWFNSGTDRIAGLGHKSDIQTVQYLLQYFGLEIQRLAEVAWKEVKAEAKANGLELPRGQVWKSSFRDGAVSAIEKRLNKERIKNSVRMGANPIEAMPENTEEERAEKQALAVELATTMANTNALVLVRQTEKERFEETQNAYNERFGRGKGKRRMRSAHWGYRQHSQNGYSAGRAAGNSIPMSGAKAGLGGAKPRLE